MRIYRTLTAEKINRAEFLPSAFLVFRCLMPWQPLLREPLPTFVAVLHCDSIAFVHAPIKNRILIYESMQTSHYFIASPSQRVERRMEKKK